MVRKARITRLWHYDNRDLEFLRILDLYASQKTASYKHIAASYPMEESSRNYIIRRLMRMGLVKIDRFIGRAVKYKLTTLGKAALGLGDQIQSHIDKEKSDNIDS